MCGREKDHRVPDFHVENEFFSSLAFHRCSRFQKENFTQNKNVRRESPQLITGFDVRWIASAHLSENSQIPSSPFANLVNLTLDTKNILQEKKKTSKVKLSLTQNKHSTAAGNFG